MEVKWKIHALFTRTVMKFDLAEFGVYSDPARSIMVLIPFLLRLGPPRVGTCTEQSWFLSAPAVCLSTSTSLCRYVALSTSVQTSKHGLRVRTHLFPLWQSLPQVFFSLVPSVSLLTSWGLSFHPDSYSENFLCASLNVCIFCS